MTASTNFCCVVVVDAEVRLRENFLSGKQLRTCYHFNFKVRMRKSKYTEEERARYKELENKVWRNIPESSLVVCLRKFVDLELGSIEREVES
jgi:hypothetical protein